MVKVGARLIPFIKRHIAAKEREETALLGGYPLACCLSDMRDSR